MKPNVSSALGNLLGCQASVAYRSLLLRHDSVQSANLFVYDAPPSMQERISVSPAEAGIIAHANDMRAGTGIPFWDALFATCAVQGRCTGAILEATFFHNGQGTPSPVSRAQIKAGILEQAVRGARRTLALGSRLTGSQGSAGHLGFLDFHCDVNVANCRIVRDICHTLMPAGFLILDSGGSFHACTTNLLSDDERVTMLARALLASPVVDARYIAHQLMQDSSSIRISRGGKAGNLPIVVDAWEP